MARNEPTIALCANRESASICCVLVLDEHVSQIDERVDISLFCFIPLRLGASPTSAPPRRLAAASSTPEAQLRGFTPIGYRAILYVAPTQIGVDRFP